MNNERILFKTIWSSAVFGFISLALLLPFNLHSADTKESRELLESRLKILSAQAASRGAYRHALALESSLSDLMNGKPLSKVTEMLPVHYWFGSIETAEADDFKDFAADFTPKYQVRYELANRITGLIEFFRQKLDEAGVENNKIALINNERARMLGELKNTANSKGVLIYAPVWVLHGTEGVDHRGVETVIDLGAGIDPRRLIYNYDSVANVTVNPTPAGTQIDPYSSLFMWYPKTADGKLGSPFVFSRTDYEVDRKLNPPPWSKNPPGVCSIPTDSTKKAPAQTLPTSAPNNNPNPAQWHDRTNPNPNKPPPTPEPSPTPNNPPPESTDNPITILGHPGFPDDPPTDTSDANNQPRKVKKQSPLPTLAFLSSSLADGGYTLAQPNDDGTLPADLNTGFHRPPRLLHDGLGQLGLSSVPASEGGLNDGNGATRTSIHPFGGNGHEPGITPQNNEGTGGGPIRPHRN